jgi:hypothetical protein
VFEQPRICRINGTAIFITSDILACSIPERYLTLQNKDSIIIKSRLRLFINYISVVVSEVEKKMP